MKAWSLLVLLIVFAIPGMQESPPPVREAHGGLILDPTPRPSYQPPPAWYQPGAAAKTGTIIVNYNPASCGTGTTPWGQDAQDAFQMGADIWASILNNTITIEIDACWVNNLPALTLGSTAATSYHSDFDGAPLSSTRYPAALANQLSGVDQNGGTSEITINFNSTFNWYFGTGMQPTDTQPNFVTVVVHELAHGLGFSSGMRFDDGVNDGVTNFNECNGTAGVGCWGGGSADPRAFARFIEDGSGNALLGLSNNTTAMGNEITSADLFFDGPTANILNGFTPPELYAPTAWAPGSSISHLAESYNGTDQALMTFSLNNGEVNHHPGQVTLGILQDLGYDLRNLSSVWVDSDNTSGVEVGSPGSPFNTVFEGVKAVYPQGDVYVDTGSYPESVSMLKAMVIQGVGGTVVIGQ